MVIRALSAASAHADDGIVLLLLQFFAVPTPTSATFHLPHSSLEPLELTVKMPSLAMAVVPRDAVAALDEKWGKAIGVYVLLGPPGDSKQSNSEHHYRCYAGQSGTGGLRERLTTHRNSPTWEKSHGLSKDWWTRALIVRSRDEDGFNSAEAGWLEGRLWDILDGAPSAQLVGKKGDDQTLPQHDRERLEQYLPAITAVLRAIGASPDTPDQRRSPRSCTSTTQPSMTWPVRACSDRASSYGRSRPPTRRSQSWGTKAS